MRRLVEFQLIFIIKELHQRIFFSFVIA